MIQTHNYVEQLQHNTYVTTSDELLKTPTTFPCVERLAHTYTHCNKRTSNHLRTRQLINDGTTVPKKDAKFHRR